MYILSDNRNHNAPSLADSDAAVFQHGGRRRRPGSGGCGRRWDGSTGVWWPRKRGGLPDWRLDTPVPPFGGRNCAPGGDRGVARMRGCAPRDPRCVRRSAASR